MVVMTTFSNSVVIPI